MERERDVKNVVSIFNLTIWKALGLPESVTTRVMFVYDKKENVKEFKILNNSLAEEMNKKITLWLEENLNVNALVHGSNSRDMDADNMRQIH